MSTMPGWQLLSNAHDSRPHHVPHRRVLPVAGRYRTSAMSRGFLRGDGRQLELHRVAARQLCPRDIEQRRYRLR